MRVPFSVTNCFALGKDVMYLKKAMAAVGFFESDGTIQGSMPIKTLVGSPFPAATTGGSMNSILAFAGMDFFISEYSHVPHGIIAARPCRNSVWLSVWLIATAPF